MRKAEVAIIGFSGCGKTTAFNALTGQRLPVGEFVGQPRVERGVFMLPDERLVALARLEASPKAVPFHSGVLDVTGLIGAEGQKAAVSDELLNSVRNADVMLLVVRAFETPGHPGGAAGPLAELASLSDELRLRDLALLDGRARRIEAQLKKPLPNRDELAAELELCRRLSRLIERAEKIDAGALSDEEQRTLRGFQLFSLKPRVVLVNTASDTEHPLNCQDMRKVVFPVALEAELAGLEAADAAAMRAELGIRQPFAAVFAAALKDALAMVSFYTSNEKEARAWALKAGACALEAADVIHSDLAKGFIRVEVAAVDDIVRVGGLKEARKAGIFREHGRDYIVDDGDYLFVRFSK